MSYMTLGIYLEVKRFYMIFNAKYPTANFVETPGEHLSKIRQRIIIKRVAGLVQDMNLVE